MLSPPGVGDVDISGNTISFDPFVPFVGTAVIRYTAVDGRGGSDMGTFTIEVGNRPPVAENVNGGTPAPGEARQVRVIPDHASDPDGDAIFVVDISLRGPGSASFSGTTVTYTAPDPSPGGPVRVEYTIQDSRGGRVGAAITFSLTASADHHD